MCILSYDAWHTILYTLLQLYSNADISIGFERGEYSFNESDADFFDTVTLIKDRQSEQMFIVTVVVQLQLRKSYRDATAGKDFSIGTVDHRINLRFGPEVNRRTVVLEIFDDAIPEGTEAFQIFSFRKITGNNPYFDCKVAEGCLASTLVKIIDDEGNCHYTALLINPACVGICTLLALVFLCSSDCWV